MVNANPQPFADQEAISSWAQGMMEQMRRYNLIGGQPGNLAEPQGLATRAQCAAVFQRLIMALLAQLTAESELLSASVAPVDPVEALVNQKVVINDWCLKVINAPDPIWE